MDQNNTPQTRRLAPTHPIFVPAIAARAIIYAIVTFAAALHAQDSGDSNDLAALPVAGERVTDTAGVLNAAAVARLRELSESLERRKGSQLIFVIVPTTAPESIEAYSLRLAEAWQIGRAGVDDGVIVLVAINDRKLRIEVGYGLEGAVPDAVAKRIIAEEIQPRFRAGDFAGGLEAAARELIARIDPEALPPPGLKERGSDWLLENRRYVDDYYMPFVFGTLIFAALIAFVRKRIALGLLLPILPLGLVGGLIAMFLHAEHLIIAAAIYPVYAMFFVFIYGVFNNWLRGPGDAAGGSGSSGSSYSGGGYSYRSSSSSSGSSGFFSGGGGSFGGGGASGSW